MSAAELLKIAKGEGVVLVLEGERLAWKADHQPPSELLAEIKAHRLEIIDFLNTEIDPPPELQAWLESVARLLGSSPDHLLLQGFIDQHDLIEQCREQPHFAARLIRSHPVWSPPTVTDRPTIEQHSTGDSQHAYQSAATASLAWRDARNQFHSHLMACRACYAPTGRYCAAGGELRQRYDSTSMEPTS